MSDVIRVGTRGSVLATTQAGTIRDAIRAAGTPAELEIITTHGDVNMAPVERIGVGVFTQKLRDALRAGECDVAVHSFKDLPTAEQDDLHLVVPLAEDPREALVARDGLSLNQLPEGARIGTSAPRRISQLRALRSDLEIVPQRGNIDTRISRVTSGELDAVVLAYAGLRRVGYQDRATDVFDPGIIMPAPAQGALAVECRGGDKATRALLNKLVHWPSQLRAQAERALLATLEAGCTAPVAAHAIIDGSELTVRGGVFSLDGHRRLIAEETGKACDAAQMGRSVAHHLLARGASDIINS